MIAISRFNQLTMLASMALYLAWTIGCAGPVGDLKTDINPDDLKPGLSVLYLDGSYRFVKLIPKGAEAREKGRPGEPILQLNHQFGEGSVFGSGLNRKIGMQMEGYLHLDTPGTYAFQALSNDGVEIYINGKLIVSDPNVHSDRLSDIGEVSVDTGGWQPFLVRYFQRKGSAALKFYWRPPGSDEFEIVPAQAYGHLSSQR
ncbi:MAG: PA14 domain-containing protein [Desulforhopalus sp.]